MHGNKINIDRNEWEAMRLTSGKRADGGRGRGWMWRGGGDATAAYQWVPFKFPGIIGGKRGGWEEKNDARFLGSVMTG